MKPPSLHDATREPRRFRSLDDADSLRAFVQRVREGLYIASASDDLLDANPAFLALLGLRSIEEARTLRLADLLVDPRRRERDVAALLAGESVVEVERQIVRPDTSIVTVLETAYLTYDELTGEPLIHGILVDITQQKAEEELLRQQSLRDPLTGCFNRRYLHSLEERLTADVEQWGCLYVDIDHFKQYNDTHGHRMGDATLVKMSRFLMRQVRAEEPVIRLGGDEFLLVLEGAAPEQVELVASRLRAAALKSAPVPFSLGAASRVDGERLHETIHRADQALLAVRVEMRGGRAQIRRA